MVSSNTETGISLTYDDTNGKIDAYVTPYDVVGGRLDLVSATQIKWGFQNSNNIKLFNPTSGQWELVQIASEPTIDNTDLDLNGTALAPNTIYDVFAEYDSSTAFDLVLSRWATGGDGANNSSTSYATPVMTSNTAPGPVVVSATSEIVADGQTYSAFRALNQASVDYKDCWATSNTPTSGSPQNLMVDFGDSICVNKYILQARINSNSGVRAFPKAWTVEGTNSGVLSDASGQNGWEILDTVTTSIDPGDGAWEGGYHSFINKRNYKKYRISITDRHGTESFAALGALKLVAASNSLAGSSSRVRAYESTVTYNIGDRVTYGGHDWVKQSSAAAGTTPVAGNDWVDNGYPVGGDGAYNASTAYATPIATGATTNGVTFSADSNVDGNTYAWWSFDQNVSQGWGSADTAVAHWLKVNYGSSFGKIINKYSIYTPGTAGYCPSTWTFQGSNDDSNWITLDTRTSLTLSTTTWYSYTFNNSTAYQYYKLNVTANQSGNILSIRELKLVEAQDDFTGLYRHNGVLVSDSSTTGKSRRWLGIIYTYNNSGTVNFKDDVNYRFVSNFYNRENKMVSAFNYSTASWTYNVAAWREFNNGNLYRGYFVSCCGQSSMGMLMVTFKSGNPGTATYVGSAFNNVTPSVQLTTATATQQTYEGIRATTIQRGFSYITIIEYGDATYPPTYYGYESQSNHNVLLRG